jgi:cation diffusion facilitator family transporter
MSPETQADHRQHDHRGLGAQRDLDHSHGHAHSHGQPSVDRAMEASREGVRALKISLAGLAATAGLQAAVVVVSGSVALLSDTLHNLSDAATAIPLWIAFRLGRRPASRRFSYGLGRAEDLAGLFVVGMIAVSAALAGWQAVAHLFNPPEIRHLPLVMAAAAIGALGNEAVAIYRIRVGRRIGSAALIADGLHARTDGLTSLAVFIGAAGVALGWKWADPVVGLAIAVAIVVVLVQAVRGVGERLLDGVDPSIIDEAVATATETDGVQAVGEVRARWVGHRLHAEANITVDRDVDVATGHRIAASVREALLDRLPVLGRVIVHVDPCAHNVDEAMSPER